MPARVQFFWLQQGDQLGGWSENYWNNRTFSDALVPSAMALFNALDKIHGGQTLGTAIRISDLANFRNVLVAPLFASTTTPADVATASDFMNTAALLKLSGTGSGGTPISYSTKQWIRSCHDGDVNSGGRWRPLASTQQALGQLRGVLTTTTNGWCIRVQDQSTPKHTIAAATSSGVLTVTGHGYSSGQKVRISRARGTIPINGLWQVTVIDANTFSLIGFQTPTGTPVYLGNGVVYAINKTLVPITDMTIVRASSHRTGRPFNQSSGRRRTQRTA